MKGGIGKSPAAMARRAMGLAVEEIEAAFGPFVDCASRSPRSSGRTELSLGTMERSKVASACSIFRPGDFALAQNAWLNAAT